MTTPYLLARRRGCQLRVRSSNKVWLLLGINLQARGKCRGVVILTSEERVQSRTETALPPSYPEVGMAIVISRGCPSSPVPVASAQIKGNAEVIQQRCNHVTEKMTGAAACCRGPMGQSATTAGA
jgi:hypothetical protein